MTRRSSQLASVPLGTVLAGYQIRALLGRGGMSEVYVAHDPRLDRDVALKVLMPQLSANVSFRDRFLRESRLAAALDHPNIVPIYEAGEADGLLYIAMRRVEGDDLGIVIERQGALSIGRVGRFVSQMASALDAAHCKHLIHRDVKPANILIEKATAVGDEVAHLSDFGLTKSLSSESRHTVTGEILGSVHYMAPEQIEGSELSPRTDVYALGCVVFEALTGKVAFERDSDLAVLWAHVNSDIPKVTKHRPSLPAVLDEVVAGALAKSPSDRYGTCGAFAADIRRAIRRRRVAPPVPVHRSVTRSGTPVVRPPFDEQPAGPLRGLMHGMRSLLVAGIGIALATAAVVGVARMTGLWRPEANVVAQGGSDGGATESVRRSSKNNNVSRHTRPGGKVLNSDGQARRNAPSDREALEAPTRAFAAVPSTGGAPEVDAPTIPDDVERITTKGYSGAAIEGVGEECLRDELGCVFFEVGARERFMDVHVSDASGDPVRAWIRSDTNGDGTPDGEWERICDVTQDPVPVVPGAVVVVMIEAGECGGSVAPAGGTVTATFREVA